METATSLAAALVQGSTSAVELARLSLDRAREHADWNVFVALDGAAALAAAEASDRRRRDGAAVGPLDGIPIAVKDNIDVAGFATTAGAAAYRDRRPAADAAVIARLRAAGTVIIGKLNLHEGALGATTDNRTFGRCENPRLPGHTPGGSSGGSGAAVAGALVPLALGTDTMGSVRIPAAYCGVWGLKPTRGLVGTSGLVHLSWTLDTIGPLASCAQDLALAIWAMAGFDAADPRSLAPSASWNTDLAPMDLRGRIFGRPDVIDKVDCEPAVREAFDTLLQRLAAAGAEVRDVTIPGWDSGKARRAGLLVSEAEAGSLMGADIDANPGGFDADFRRLVSYGRTASAEKLAAAHWTLDHLGHAARQAVAGFDALLMPTAPQHAFAHGSSVPANQADFTALANIAGLPAVAFPLPSPPDDAPASAQLLGAPFSEGHLLNLAREMAAP